MSHIFVSYASEDRDRIMPVVRALEATGWSVFWDRTIPVGETWQKIIGAEIEACRCMVVIWSAASINKEWVYEEASEGKRRGVLAPVLIDDIIPPIGFRTIQAAKLEGWNGNAASAEFDRLIKDISHMLGTRPLKMGFDRVAEEGKQGVSGFSFTPSSALTPELQKVLETSLQNFKAFLIKLGFAVPLETISVTISPGTIVDNQGWFALWDSTTHSIMVASAFASDDVWVLRQLAHALIKPSGEPSPHYSAIESGLATYFPCSFTHTPMMGEKASAAGKAIVPPQDLRKRRKFVEIRLDDWSSVQNDGSEVWGGALWEIRQLLGPETADRLIANTWQAFPPKKQGNAYVSFRNKLLTNSRSIEGGRYKEQVREIFQRRGLRL